MIKNTGKGTIICSRTKILKSVLSKAIGLMFSKPIRDEGFVFVFTTPRRIDLHMFFVFFPIDVIFLDSSNKVIEIKENFLPFSVYYSGKNASCVIELEAGAVKKSRTSLNDILSIREPRKAH